MKYYLKFLKKRIISIVIIVLLSVVTASLFWIVTIINQQIVDNAFNSQDISFLISILPHIIVLVFMILATEIVNARVKSKLVSKYSTDIQNDFYRRMIHSNYIFLKTVMPNDIYYRMFVDISVIAEYIITLVIAGPVNFITIVILFFAMFKWSRLLACFVMACIVFQVIVVKFFETPVKNATEEFRTVEQDIATTVSESFSVIDLIKSFNAEDWQNEKVKSKLNLLYLKKISTEFLAIIYKAISSLINTFWSIALLLLAAWLSTKGSVTIGIYVAISMIAGYIYNPIQQLVNLRYTYQQANVSLGRVHSYTQSGNTKIPSDKKLKFNFKKSIQLINITFSLNKKKILNGVNLCFDKGHSYAIVGKSGVGKTTTVSLIAGLVHPTHGEILIDGINIDEIEETSLRNNIGYMPQKQIIFEDSIYNNIAIGRNLHKNDVLQELYDVGLQELIDNMPDSLDTNIGSTSRNLSEGEKQRICLVRTLIGRPQIVLLDEPTAHVDNTNCEIIKKCIKNYIIKTNATVIVITHDMSLAKDLDFVVELFNH